MPFYAAPGTQVSGADAAGTAFVLVFEDDALDPPEGSPEQAALQSACDSGHVSRSKPKDKKE